MSYVGVRIPEKSVPSWFMYTANVVLWERIGCCLCLLQYVKSREINPHAKEAWKVTKSGVKGTVYQNIL